MRTALVFLLIALMILGFWGCTKSNPVGEDMPEISNVVVSIPDSMKIGIHELESYEHSGNTTYPIMAVVSFSVFPEAAKSFVIVGGDTLIPEGFPRQVVFNERIADRYIVAIWGGNEVRRGF